MDVRTQASEARREAGRLEQLARAAREREGARCRDRRGEEQRLLARAAEAEAKARSGSRRRPLADNPACDRASRRNIGFPSNLLSRSCALMRLCGAYR